MAFDPRMREGIIPSRHRPLSMDPPVDPDMDPGDFAVDIYGTKVRVPWSKVEAAQKRFQDQVGPDSINVVTCGTEVHSALVSPMRGIKDRFKSDTMGYVVSSSSGRTMRQLRESTDPSETRGTWSVILRSLESFRRKVKRGTVVIFARLQEEAQMCNVNDMLEFHKEMKEKAEACFGIGQGDGGSISLERSGQVPVKNVGIYDHLISFLPLIGLGDENKKTFIIELPKDFEEQINKKKGRREGRKDYHKIKVYKEPSLEVANAEEPGLKQDDDNLSTRRVDEEANLANEDEQIEVLDDERADIPKHTEDEDAEALDDDMSDITTDSEAVVIEPTETQLQNEEKMEEPTDKTDEMLDPSQQSSNRENTKLEGSQEILTGVDILPGRSNSQPKVTEVACADKLVEQSKSKPSQPEPQKSIKQHTREEVQELEHRSASVWKKLKKITNKKKRIASTLFGEALNENKRRAAKPHGDSSETPGSETSPIILEPLDEHISPQPEQEIVINDYFTSQEGKHRMQKETFSAEVDDEKMKTGSTERPRALLKESIQDGPGLKKEQRKTKQKKGRRDRVKADKRVSKERSEKKKKTENKDLVSLSRDHVLDSTRDDADKSVKAASEDESPPTESKDDQRDDACYWRKTGSHLRQTPDSRNSEEEHQTPPKRYFRSRKPPAFLKSSDETVGTFEVFAAHGKTELEATSSPHQQEEKSITLLQSEKVEVPILPGKDDDDDDEMKPEDVGSQNASYSLEEELAKLRQSHAAVFAEGLNSIQRHTRPKGAKPSLASNYLAGNSHI